MKKVLLAIMALSAALTSNAQIVSSTSKTITSRTTSETVVIKESANYNRLYFGFANLKPHYSADISGVSGLSSDIDKTNEENVALPGFNFGYLRGISLTSAIPLYLEVGGEMIFNSKEGYLGLGEYDKHADDFKTKLLSVAVPMNLTYKFTFGNGLYVAPYAGISFKINLMGITSYDDSDNSSTANLFTSSDMGEDNAYNRFQFGGQFGLNFGYKALNLNIGYTLHAPIWSVEESGDYMKLNTRSFTAGIGVNF